MITKLISLPIAFGIMTAPPPAEAESIVSVFRLQPEAQEATLPAGESSMALGMRLQADCSGKTSIGNITFVHEGTGSMTEIRDIAFKDGTGKRHPATFRGFDDWSRTSTLRFLKPLELTSCEAKDLFAFLTLSPTAKAGGTHALSLELPTDVVTGSVGTTIAGNAFPLHGVRFTVGNAKKVSDTCMGATAKNRALCRRAKRTPR